jgi:hypothetical protein
MRLLNSTSCSFCATMVSNFTRHTLSKYASFDVGFIQNLILGEDICEFGTKIKRVYLKFFKFKYREKIQII